MNSVFVIIELQHVMLWWSDIGRVKVAAESMAQSHHRKAKHLTDRDRLR